MRKLLSILLLLVVFLSGWMNFRMVRKLWTPTDHDLDAALSESQALGDFLPDTALFPKPEGVSFTKVHHRGLFAHDCYLLRVEGDGNFEAARRDITARYTYLEESPVDVFGTVTIPTMEFAVGTYQFRVVTTEDPYDYPKFFGMIGVSEQEQTVLYLWYSDQDLDFIEDMAQFVTKEWQLDLKYKGGYSIEGKGLA